MNLHRSSCTILFLLALPGLVLTGCANRAQTGAGVGAMTGALAGSLLGSHKNKEQWALLGAAAGGMAGYAFGNEMDKQDRYQVNQAFERTPSQQTSSWVNPDNGRRYGVTPTAAYRDNNGRTCREADIETVIDGRREVAKTTACRRGDGQWEM